MRHHQECLITSIQKSLQPFYHLQIQMVCRLIENQQIRVGNQHIGQSHSFLLTATQLSHGLLQIFDFQLRQNLFSFQHLFFFALVVETSIQHTFRRIEDGRLFQHAYTQIAAEDNLTRIIAFFTREHRQQR